MSQLQALESVIGLGILVYPAAAVLTLDRSHSMRCLNGAAFWLLTAAIFIVLIGPAAALLALVPGHYFAWGFAFAFIFAWGLKAALLEPVAIVCLMQVYFKTIEGQTPNPEWEARLDSVSKRFRELGAKAAGWVGAGPAGKPGPA